jgi:OOP family OmpA-OmpF porin
MKKIARYWLVIALLWIVNQAKAQYVYDYKRTGDIYYEAKDYYSAAQYYTKVLGTFKIKPEQILPYAVDMKKGKENGKIKDYESVVYRLGESYRQYNDFGNAEKYYEQAVSFNNNALFPLARFWYGVCLRANGKYTEAIDQLKMFKQQYTKADDISNRATLEISCCEFAISEAGSVPGFTIVKLGGDLNGGGANYAPATVGKSMLLYTSSRPDSAMMDAAKKVRKTNPYINNLFMATGSGTSFSNSKEVSIPELRGVDQGVATVSPDGNTIYLTRWTTQNNIKLAAVYTSTKMGDKWSDPKSMGQNVNVDGYSSMQPFVTEDGKYLFFASNRPGGMGKNDLWYCALEKGVPSPAKNLGTVINTRDEEQAPFYDARKKALIFSTDGRVGLGGLDFFSSEGDIGNWSAPKNLGAPFNSPKDDIYYTTVDKQHPMARGYISSDRESVCCLELFSIKKINKTLNGLILDCDNNLPLTGAKVTLLDTIQQRVLQQITLDETGHYSFDVEVKKHYKIMAEKENYFSKAIYVETDGLLKVDSMVSPTICLKHFEIGKPIILKDIYYDFDKATLRSQSLIVLDTVVAIMLDNPNIIIEMSAHTDSKGKDAYNIKLSQKRAQACVDYLISKGISTSRMIAKGYGKTRPIAPNTLPDGKDNPEGRQLNRRTEFKVLRVTQESK